jgi:hypothetical protein
MLLVSCILVFVSCPRKPWPRGSIHVAWCSRNVYQNVSTQSMKTIAPIIPGGNVRNGLFIFWSGHSKGTIHHQFRTLRQSWSLLDMVHRPTCPNLKRKNESISPTSIWKDSQVTRSINRCLELVRHLDDISSESHRSDFQNSRSLQTESVCFTACHSIEFELFAREVGDTRRHWMSFSSSCF